MAAAALILYQLGVVLTGAAALLLLSRETLLLLSRLEKLGTALLLGLCIQSFAALLLIFAGVKLSGWMPVGISAVALAFIVVRSANLTALVASASPPLEPASMPLVRVLFAAGAVVMFTFVVLAVIGLPTFDYDGLVIWTTRIKVLLAERTIYSEALRDPERLIPQPKHPFLIPVMQALFCLPGKMPSFAAAQAPYVWVYAAYLCLAWCAARFADSIAAKIVLAASLILLPAIPAELFVVSAREPIVAVFALASTYFLSMYLGDSRRGYLVISGFFALMVQQAKIDGLPFAAGWIAAVVFLAASRIAARKDAACAVALLALAVPWWLVKRQIPASPFDPPYMTDYSALLGVQLVNVARVAWLIASELFLRPELYGFAPHAMVVALAVGWTRQNLRDRLLALLPAVTAAAAVFAVYVLRQGELPAERNASITRHVMGFLPAMILAAWFRGGSAVNRAHLPVRPPVAR